jgi:hypothetical protein
MTSADLHGDLQKLIEARLDAMDRVLMGAQISWSERRSIVGEVEIQIFELLARRTQSPTEEDVLAVLASLDPPESYIPDDSREAPATVPEGSSTPRFEWRELRERIVRNAASLATGALYVAGVLAINGIAVAIVAASHGVIPWLVTLGLLAWLNYSGMRRLQAWSATRNGRLLDDLRFLLAGWLLPKNGVTAA